MGLLRASRITFGRLNQKAANLLKPIILGSLILGNTSQIDPFGPVLRLGSLFGVVLQGIP